MLAPGERRELLDIARDAIAAEMRRRLRSMPLAQSPPQTQPEENTKPVGALDRPGGAFVTLRIEGDLRGCIGYIESPIPLRDVVRDVAIKAAFEDPRFEPLTPEELQAVSLEISVLSPLKEIRGKDEVRVGEHGLVMERGVRRGLLLPQVAVEYAWEAEEFLDNTARKAGLPATAWRDPGTRVFVFNAEVISEGRD